MRVLYDETHNQTWTADPTLSELMATPSLSVRPWR